MSNETELKAKLFDANETITQLQEQVRVYGETLGGISQLLAVEPNEEGTVSLQSIIDAVKEVVKEEPSEVV